MTTTTIDSTPWPACPDCQVPEHTRPAKVAAATCAEESVGDDIFSDIPLSQDFGPWAAEVHRRAAASFARAVARVRGNTTRQPANNGYCEQRRPLAGCPAPTREGAQ